MRSDNVISVLIGLIGACSSNPKTPETDDIVLSALAFSRDCVSPEKEREMVDIIRREKYSVSPNCASCAMPCGNTSDYDMNRIYGAPEDIREAKLKLLDAISALAARIYDNGEKPSQNAMYAIFTALTYIALDLPAKEFSALTDELAEI